MKKLLFVLALLVGILCPESLAAASLPAGFDINTVVVRETGDGWSYFTLNNSAAKQLKSMGFKFVRSTREKVYLGSEDDSPTSVKANVYEKGGIEVTVAGTSEFVNRITIVFPDAETLRQFIETARKLGYAERNSFEGSTTYGIDDSALEMTVKGLKAVFQFNS